MEKQEKNLQLWKQVEVTPTSWLKNANISGNQIKAINPQKQLKQATELFGPYGSTWGLRDCKRQIIELENMIKLIMLEAVFYYPEGSFEISNSTKLCYKSSKGKYIVDDEAFKKLETNTRSKALSFLGFGADVFEGRFDVEGYEKIVDYVTETELSKAEIDGAIKLLNSATDETKLSKTWNSYPKWHQNKEIFEAFKDTLQTLQQLKQ